MDDVLKRIQAVVKPLLYQLKNFIKFSNRRQLLLRNKEGRSLFRIPLTLAIIIALFSMPLRIFPLLVIAVVVAIFLKYEFRIVPQS